MKGGSPGCDHWVAAGIVVAVAAGVMLAWWIEGGWLLALSALTVAGTVWLVRRLAA